MRQHLIEAIAAHFMVHTECKLNPEIALERAQEAYEYAIADADRISISPPSGRYTGKQNYLQVALTRNSSGHTIVLAIRTVPDPTGHTPLRLTYGTKRMNTSAWDLVRSTHAKTNVARLKEEARRAREERTRTTATMKS